ncbi:MAG: 6-carboxytetrahydropterin synthase [Phycisphaerae bacterium]|jgi:6-pyruvoyltetrahydropterin/6-carboxytetrahydropterin synthase
MFEVSVSAWFAAAHRLRLPDGSFEPLHGHNWRVAVTCAGPKLDPMGVLIDFTRLKPRLDDLLRELHDRCLNELPAFRERNPSAENVALHLAESLTPHLPAGAVVRSVEVEEAPGCVARYFPPAA